MHAIDLVRQRCVTSPALLVLGILGDLGMLAAYLWIPRSLRRIAIALPPGTAGRRELRGTAAFVQACGLTHAWKAATLFFPALDWPALLWLYFAVAISLFVGRRLARMRAELTGALTGFARLSRFVAAAPTSDG